MTVIVRAVLARVLMVMRCAVFVQRIVDVIGAMGVLV